MKRPASPVVRTLADKTLALKMMSMDMASAGVIGLRAPSGGPVIARNSR